MNSFSYLFPLIPLHEFETSETQATVMNEEPPLPKHIEMKASLSAAHSLPDYAPNVLLTPIDVQTCHGLSCLCVFGSESPFPEFLSLPPHHHLHPLYNSEYRSVSSSSRKFSLIPQDCSGGSQPTLYLLTSQYLLPISCLYSPALIGCEL